MENAINSYLMEPIEVAKFEQKRGVKFFDADDYKGDKSIDNLGNYQLSEDEQQYFAKIATDVR